MDPVIEPVPGDTEETSGKQNAEADLPSEADVADETVVKDTEETTPVKPAEALESSSQPDIENEEILGDNITEEDDGVDQDRIEDVTISDDPKTVESMEVDNEDGPAAAEEEEETSVPNTQQTESTFEPLIHSTQMEEQSTSENGEENTEIPVSQNQDTEASSQDNIEQETGAIVNSPEEMETDGQTEEAILNKSAELSEEHPPEEVDMADVAETSISEREKQSAEDPFDSVKQNSSLSHDKDDSVCQTHDEVDSTFNNTLDESRVSDRNATNPEDSLVGEVVDNDVSADDIETTLSTQHEEHDSTHQDADTTINDVSGMADSTSKDNFQSELTEEPVAVGEDLEDLERGQGVDEELSLLPDADREITEADKEKALKAEEEAAAAESVVIDEDKEEEVVANRNTETASTEASVGADDNVTKTLKDDEIKELHGDLVDVNCFQCKEKRPGQFTFLNNSEASFLCSHDCVTAFRALSTNFTLLAACINVHQMYEVERKCVECELTKMCIYRFNQPETTPQYLCSDECLTKHFAEQPDKYTVKRIRIVIEEKLETTNPAKCLQCFEVKVCSFSFRQEDEEFNICQENCLNLLQKEQPELFRMQRRLVRVRDLPKRAGHGSATIEDPNSAVSPAKFDGKIVARTEAEADAARLDRDASFVRQCAQCHLLVVVNEKTLQWETMDFCNETCLGQYQHIIGAACTTCQGAVQMTSLGKYCVRFGYEIRQFCRSACLDQFKKGLKVCSFCQKDISKDENGFLASIGGQFKDFCRASCMKKYDEMCNPKKKCCTRICAVCMNVDQVRVEVMVNDQTHSFCSNPCFSAFQFVNNINSDKCQMCQKYFERQSANAFTIYQNAGNTTMMYCSKVCLNIYIITHRKIVPCQWCKVKKYNFDMIQKFVGGLNTIMLCSLNCLTLCEVSMNAMSMKKQQCDQCMLLMNPQYHLTMSDASIRNFCTYQCVMSFQSRFSRAPLTLESQLPTETPSSPVPTGLPKRIKSSVHQTPSNKLPVISSTTSLATTGSVTASGKQLKFVNKGKPPAKQMTNKVPIISNVTSLASGITTRTRKGGNLQPVVQLEPLPSSAQRKSNQTVGKINHSHSDVQKPPPPIVQVKTQIVTIPPVPKRVSNMSTMCTVATETKETQARPKLVTIGCQTEESLEKRYFIPIPVPIYVPQPMHMYSLPTPIPVPFPLPIPVPIFIPTTRNSANGIMKEIKKIQDKMPTDPFEAELLMMAEMVAGDKKKNDSDSGSDDERDNTYTSMNEGAALGEDMLQMALKMAQEYEEPAVDLESSMATNTIRPDAQNQHMQFNQPVIVDLLGMGNQQQQRIANPPEPVQRGRKRAVAQPRNSKSPGTTPPNKRTRRQDAAQLATPTQPEPVREPVEKADANMCLKFTFGVNAWKQWVMTKNADLEKSSIRRKPFKSELLQLTADELNYSMCLFVKEVRKPNGSEYAPDTIYYLVLGIQQYLYENGRIDNIFTDPYYERFTDCLDSVAKKFSVLYNDSQYIVTRVEEEHLWECKQLGAHSPHVLLSTLMFFNTKHFNLTTVEEHTQLSFSHIMKHWKRSPNQVGSAKTPGTRNVLLRFYPPQATLDSNSRKKKVYEQQESEDNPLRCPVKLYEFYLSKCPESVKTRNDVFYLQPERSCVPDSPVWYSTQALGKPSLCKMLHRVKMVKEINIALLTS